MPLTQTISANPWKRSVLLGLFLGVWFFLPFAVNKALAIDSTSPLFEKSQSGSTDKSNNSQPLALPEEKPNPSPGLLSTLVQVFFYLILIVGLIILTVWGVKFVWEKQGWNHLTEPGKPIKVLTTTYLAPRKAIHLVEVGKRLLVVGVGNEEIHCLDVITEKEEVDELRQATQQGFPKIFNRIIKKQDAAQAEQETNQIIEEGNQLVGGYVEKLKKISKKKKGPGEEKGEGQ